MSEERRAVRPTRFVPVEAKFLAPALREGHVPRGQLVDRLIESPAVPVVLVTGPPGYGKSVLAAQWAAEDPRPFTWLAVDAADNDPVVLVTYLVLALHRVEPVDPHILAPLYADEPSLRDVVLPTLRSVLSRRQPFVLVLDKSDVLTSEPALEVLTTVAESLPTGAQVLLAGRVTPALDWEALRARSAVLEIGVDELRFGRMEARALARAAGVQLAEAELGTLLEKTEGWPAGMYLAALSLNGSSPGSTVETLAGSDELIADYLRDQLINLLPADEQQFLVRTSVLTWLSGELCDAVLGSSDSAETLRRLGRANVMLSASDDDPGWYRVHPLLAQALRAELRRREPQAEKLLHLRASEFMEQTGDVMSAISHAVAADDVERAARLIWSEVPAALAHGSLNTLQGWLDQFTPAQVTAHAKLALTAAARAVQRGELADLWVTSAERGTYDAGRVGEAASVAGATAMLHAVLARNGVLQMGADARLASRLLEPDDPWQCTVCLLAGVSTWLTGHAAEGRLELEAIRHRAKGEGTYQCEALALTQMALVDVGEDGWHAAEPLLDEAYRLAVEHSLGALMSMLPLHCARTVLAAREGRSDDAATGIRQYASRLAVMEHAPAWVLVQCRQLLASAALVLGDAAAARTLLSEAQLLLGHDPGAVALREALERTWREIEQTPLTPAGGPSTLTSAELRVLQLLPTHLSFEEIGRQLFVSRNTVKTQAVSAYRKLGVSSRTDAVQRAFALGLITGEHGREA